MQENEWIKEGGFYKKMYVIIDFEFTNNFITVFPKNVSQIMFDHKVYRNIMDQESDFFFKFWSLKRSEIFGVLICKAYDQVL